VCPACPIAVHGLHTPRFTLDEGVLKVGAALHTALASEYLEQWHSRVQARAREEL
jgi:metal-dependent amidase/aminoacylase/carboxypeptidase family protein